MNKYGWYAIWIISFFIGRLTSSIYSVNHQQSTKIVEQKEVINVDSRLSKKIIIRENTDALGNHSKVTKIDIHSNKNIASRVENQNRHQEDKKIISNRRPGTVNISALITPYTKGVCVTKELIGPITVGAFALTNGTFGASLGLNL